MCTAITLNTDDFYFGRTLDNEFSYFEEITITPRNFRFQFRHIPAIEKHYAMIGMAFNKNNFPLYYDAVNEKGLCIAGLNFVGNAHYGDFENHKENIAQFELIPYILGKCISTDEAIKLIKKINIINTPFSDDLPLAQLHWIIADSKKAITLEATKHGINVYDNPLGVLTNNPEFPIQMQNLSNYMGLSAEAPKNTFCKDFKMNYYSKGMGAIGLPGDLSSMSRFVRTAFTKLNSVCDKGETESVNRFFHILGTVQQTNGVTRTAEGMEKTIYTSCCNADKGIYYYTTYENLQISAVNINKANLESTELIRYPLILKSDIKMQN